MADFTIKNGQKISSADGGNYTVEFAANVQKPGPMPTWWIEVITGNIQFASDEEVTADHHVWGAGSKVPMTVFKQLNFKGQNALGGDEFVVTV